MRIGRVDPQRSFARVTARDIPSQILWEIPRQQLRPGFGVTHVTSRLSGFLLFLFLVPRSNNFHDEISQFAFATDFQQNVYYVAVTMTGPAMILGIPPAIQLMQLKS
jgi:hypothetical protein